MSLDSALSFVVNNQALLCTLLALALSELLPFTKGTTNGILQGILDALRARAAAKSASKPAPAKLRALVLLPLVFLATLPGCAFCKDAVNAAEPRCVLESNMVKCGESAGFALVPLVLSLIAGVIAGQPFDAAALESQLLANGVKDVPCVLAALEDYLAGSALAKGGDPASLLLAQQIHAALIASLQKRNIHGKVSMRLRGGHTLDAVVP